MLKPRQFQANREGRVGVGEGQPFFGGFLSCREFLTTLLFLL